MDPEEEKLYSFTHQRADGVVTEGYIPIGFLGMLPVEDDNVYLAVRKSPMGPEFRISHKTENQVLCDWDLNPDAMWGQVVSQFDKRDIFSEKTMNYLDADPFALFGVDDLVTQKALRKLEKFPVLLCRGAKPDSDEWFSYLELDSERDAHLSWVVQSLGEMEIPAPWTSYKRNRKYRLFLESPDRKNNVETPVLRLLRAAQRVLYASRPSESEAGSH